MLQAACALWATASAFVIDMSTPLMIRLTMVLWIVLTLATYGGAIYLVYNTRHMLAKFLRAHA